MADSEILVEGYCVCLLCDSLANKMTYHIECQSNPMHFATFTGPLRFTDLSLQVEEPNVWTTKSKQGANALPGKWDIIFPFHPLPLHML